MKYIAAVAVAVGLVLILIASLNSIPTRESCARKLRIHYSVDDGATEQLDAFSRCTTR